MIDFTNKYKAIVEKNNLHPNVLNDIACSLCIADQNWDTNDKKLSIDALLSTVDLFEGICSHKQVPNKLPRIQVKRLLLDTLIIALKFEDKDVNDELTLSSEASRKMASRIGVSYKCLNYYDEVTADRYIDLLYSVCNKKDNSEFKSEFLKFVCKQPFMSVLVYDFIKNTSFDDITQAYKSILKECFKYLTESDFAKAMGIRARADLICNSFGKCQLYITDSDFKNLKKNKVIMNAIGDAFTFTGAEYCITTQLVLTLVYVIWGSEYDLLQTNMGIRRLVNYGIN